MGRDPFNQNFRKFRSKTEWIGSVQTEQFRKNGSTFRGGPLYSVGPVRSKLTVPFVVFGKILIPSTSLFVTVHRCYVQWLCCAVCFGFLKTVYFPRGLTILFVIRKWCLKIFELNLHISGSTQNNRVKFLRMQQFVQYH